MLRITGVDAILLSHVFPEPIELSYFGGSRRIYKRDAMVVRVRSGNGLTGYGPGPASASAKRSVDEVVAPFLHARSLADPDALRVMFHKTQAGNNPFHSRVYCAVEIALYDLLGKALGVPVSELLGGRVRDHIRLYGSAGMYMPAEQYAEEAQAVAEMGFRAYKMRPALGPEEDVRTVKLMREATGGTFDLMVDAHTWWRMGDRSYSEETVERAAEQMSEYDIAWLEEPLPPDNHRAYQRLRDKNIVPLAAGEHEPAEASFLDLILNGCVDVAQMDVVCQGGYPMARRLMPEIAKEGLRFAFHSWGTALEVVAAAQLGICWPETVVEWLEYPCYSAADRKGMYAFPLASELLRDPLEIDHGDLVAPREPGLGVTVDERVFERYAWKAGPWSDFTVQSPPGTLEVTGDHTVQWSPAEN